MSSGGSNSKRRRKPRSRRSIEEIEAAARDQAARAAEDRAKLERKEIALRSRAIDGQIDILNRGFDSERRHRLRTRSAPVGGSADSMRERSGLKRQSEDVRDHARNNTIVRAFIAGAMDVVVGSGPTFQVRSTNKEFNGRAEAFFRHWWQAEIDRSREHSGADVCCTFVGEWLRSGRMGLNLTSDGDTQEIESDRIVNPAGKSNGRLFVNGIEKDETGRAIAYHVAEWNETGTTLNLGNTKRILARHFVHVNRPTLPEPNLSAAEPGLQAAIERLELVDDTLESGAISYRMSTMLAAVVTSPYPADMQDSMISAMVDRGSDDTNAGVDVHHELQTGTIVNAGLGTNIAQVRGEHPSTPYQQYVWLQLQLIAAELRIPLEIIFFYFIRNFSASRGAMAIAQRGVDRYRAPLTFKVCQRLYRWRVGMEIRRGSSGAFAGVEIPDNWRVVDVLWPPLPQLDPKHEIEAARLAVDGRFKPHSQAARELTGADWAETAEQIEREQADMRKRGILPEAMPGATAVEIPAPKEDEVDE